MCRCPAVGTDAASGRCADGTIAVATRRPIGTYLVHAASPRHATSSAVAAGCAGNLPGWRLVAQATATAANGGATRGVGKAHGVVGKCDGTCAHAMRARLSASPRLGVGTELRDPARRLGRPPHAIETTSDERLGCPQDLTGMACAASLGCAVAAVRADSRQPILAESDQAGAILHSARPADSSTQHQPVQGRAAACFEIRLVPHVRHGQARTVRTQVIGAFAAHHSSEARAHTSDRRRDLSLATSAIITRFAAISYGTSMTPAWR